MKTSNHDIFREINTDFYFEDRTKLEFYGFDDDETSVCSETVFDNFYPQSNQSENQLLTQEIMQLKQKLAEYEQLLKASGKQNAHIEHKPQDLSNELINKSFGDVSMEILNDIENPFPKYTVTESTVRPYPVFLIDYKGDPSNLLIKAVPSPGYNFKIENHIAYYKSKDQLHNRSDGKKVIIFEVLQINDVGKADGEPIQIDFSLYLVDGPTSYLLTTVQSPQIIVYNHSQYLPAPEIVKLLPEYCLANRSQEVNAYGPLFLRKNNILECQLSEENGRQVVLYTGKDIIRKRNCFHSFSFLSPIYKEGTVLVRCRYKNRDFGTGKTLTFISDPVSHSNNMTKGITHEEYITPQMDMTNPNSRISLLDSGSNFNLNYYSYAGHYEDLRSAIAMNSEALSSYNDQYGMTPLHWAVLGKNIQCVRLLLEKGINPDIVSKFSETALHIACRLGLFDIVVLLVEFGAFVNVRTPKDISVLHHAVFSGNEMVVKYILDMDEGFDLIDQYDCDMFTPLHYAVFKGHDHIAKILLQYGINENLLDIGDANKMTPLHWACALEEIECVRLFLSSCTTAQVNLKDVSGRTPLFYSILSPNTEICRELLKYNADPNAQDVNRETALFYAVSNKEDTLVSLLLENNADSNILNIHNEKPFPSEFYHKLSHSEESISNEEETLEKETMSHKDTELENLLRDLSINEDLKKSKKMKGNIMYHEYLTHETGHYTKYQTMRATIESPEFKETQ